MAVTTVAQFAAELNRPAAALLEQLNAAGVGKASPSDAVTETDKARLLGTEGGTSLVELTLHSGRNRIVRRMMAEVGHPVVDLVRRQFGPLHLGTLPAGRARELTTVERGALLTIARRSTPDPEHD